MEINAGTALGTGLPEDLAEWLSDLRQRLQCGGLSGGVRVDSGMDRPVVMDAEVAAKIALADFDDLYDESRNPAPWTLVRRTAFIEDLRRLRAQLDCS